MASTDAGLSSLSLATYSNTTYYSTYFGGSSDYLSIATNAAFQFGTGDFTIEAWVYLISGTTGTIFDNRTVSVSTNPVFYISNATTVSYYVAGAGVITSGSVTLTGNWNHLALSRVSGSTKMFINGVQSGSTYTDTNNYSTSGAVLIGAGLSAANSLVGYISNLRVLKGTGLYTAAFNPPNIQLTAIANTALLTCNTNSFTDGSVNNFTITRGGNVNFKQFTPTLQVTASATLTPTFSTGTTTYNISVPSNIVAISVTPTAVDPALEVIKYNGNVTLTSGQSNIASSAPAYTTGYSETFSAGLLIYANAAPVNTQGYSWTVEYWMNPTGNYANYNTMFAKRVSGTTTTAYQGYLKITTGVLGFYNGTLYDSTYTLPANTWSHVAYTYDGNQVSIYVNGRKVYGVVVTVTDNTEPLTIGGARGYTEWTIGNISNFRMVKGYVIYTDTFTPPTSPLSLTQSSSKGIRAITGAPTNGNSVFFNGTSDYLTVPGAGGQFAFGTGNFTVEGWFYSNSLTSDRVIFSIQSSWSVRVNTTGFLVWYISGLNAGTSSIAVTTGTWNHFAVVRSGTGTNQFVIYLNGAPVYTNTRSDNITSTSNLYIGELDAGNSNYFAGYMSNLRILKGTALYTSLFAPSATPLTNITNTSVLALQTTITADASTNNFTLTASGSPRLATNISPFNTAGAASTQFLGTSLAYQTISNPYSPALSLGQGHNNFTAEAWVYLTATPPVAPGWYIIQKGVNSTPGLEWSFGITSTGLYFQTASGIPTGTTTSTAFTANIIPGQWMHLALTKVGTSVHFWFNGFYTGTVNGVNNLLYNANVASYITIANTQTGATTAFAGFINNARVVYGKALYTVNYDVPFTPSTTPLSLTQSTTSTTASIDNASSYVVNNGSSVFFNNTNDFLTFPEPANLFNSIVLNGTSQYLITPTSAAFTFGTGDFTVEFYFNGPSQTNRFFYDNRPSTSNGYPHITTGLTTSVLRWGPTNIQGSIVIGDNRWHHCAVTRESGTIKLWVDGVLDTSGSDTTNYSTNYAAYIGVDTVTSTFLAGNLSNYRVIKGTALYTTAFTPSTIPLTRTSQGAIASQVSLLALQNPTIIDNSTNAFTITNTGTVTTSQNQPFALYGDGTAVTVEAWVMLGVAPTTRGWIINNSATTTGYFGVAIEAGRTITVWSDSNVTAVLTSATLIPLYTWTHIAVTFVNQLLVIYINGVRDTNTIGKSTVWQAATLGTVYVGRQASAAAQYFPGYITNLRMVYGLSVYTSKFTVPSNTLTAIDNTVFLGLQSSVTLDTSINNATITKGTGATGLILSPLTSPFTTYLPTVTNGNSIAFGWQSGTSPTDYLTLATGYVTSVQLPGDFTIESWIYMAATPAAYCLIIDSRTVVADSYGFGIYNSTGLKLDFYYGTAGRLTGTTLLAISTWYHVAVTRQNGVIKLWINGIQEATVSLTTDLGGRNSTVRIGSALDPNYWSGYLSNTRMVIGTALYTGTFTPSVTPYSLTTSSSTNTVAVTGITTYPSISNPNGINYSGSVYFGAGNATGTTLYVDAAVPLGRYDLATYDFTIEGWFYVAQLGSSQTIISLASTNAAYDWKVYVNQSNATTGTLNFVAPSINFTSASITINQNQWNHFAAVRISTAFNMYLNGVSIYSNTIVNGKYIGTGTTTNRLTIGASYGSDGGVGNYVGWFYGYLSNIRVVKGYGVYTGTFTPDRSPTTNTQGIGSINTVAIIGTNTSLLALQNATTTDASTNNFTLTATGSPTVSGSIIPYFSKSGVTNASSGYFNGATYLYTTAGATGGLNQLTSGTTGDYTIEAWVYMTGAGPTGTSYSSAYTICGTSNGTNSINLLYGITNAGYIFMSRSGGAYITVNNITPSLNKWAHVAFVNAGTTMSIYLNGVKLANTVELTGTWAVSGAVVTAVGHNGGNSLGGQFTGYITNFRAVGGVQVYTGNFTPLTGPLSVTQSSGTNISAITSGQTKILLIQNNLTIDASTNAYTFINRGVTLSVGGPFASTNGYSVGFTGSSQYITAPSDAVFTFDTNDFTIEAWVYLSSGTTGTIFDSRTGASTIHPVLYITSSSIRYATGGTDRITGSTLSTVTWYHIALVRISGSTKLYVNGIQSGSTYTDTNNYLIGSPSIGTGYSSANPLNGYISNLRVVKGLGVYTSTFATPTSTLTRTQSSSGAEISLGSEIPSLGNSVFFNGTTDYMKVPSTVSDMSTGDFTIETYYYPTSFAAITTLLGQYTAATTALGYWNIQITTAGIITVYYNGSTNFTASTAIFINEWAHIALVRISGTLTLYVNGVSYGTASYSGKFGLTSVASAIHIGVTQAAATYAVGYMSNLRIVKGVGVYSGAFTVPTNPLSTSQNSTSGFISITGTQTSLLALQNTITTDNSTNNFTLSATGSPTVSTIISPFLPAKTLYSASFNGTNASLTVPVSGSILNLGTGDFTVECWFNASRIPSTSSGDEVFTYGSFGNEDMFRIDVFAGTVRFRYNTAAQQSGGTNIANSAISTGTWYHIAMVRISGTVACYVNGTSVGSASLTTSYNTAYSVRIGALNTPGSATNAPNYWFQGYISNVRLVKGLGVYTGNFTTPTTALNTIQLANTNITALTGTETVLLTCQDSIFTDKSVNNLSITNDNGSTTSTSSVIPSLTYYNPIPNNGYSIQFAGSSQYITAPSNAVFTFGTGDFTIEGWIYLNSTTTSGTLFDNRTGASTTSPQIYIASNVVNYAVAGSSVITGATVSTSAWYHIAVVKISGSTKLYVNGVQSGSTYTDSNNYVIGSPYIGTGFSSSNPLNGYISNLRVVKGVGVYSTTFNPSSLPLAATQSGGSTNAVNSRQTSLLLYQNSPFTDNSTYNNIVTGFGNPQYSPVFSPSYFTYPTPVNGNSGYFNGTSSFLSLTQPSNAGTGDFTIEMWVYPTSLAAIGYLLSTSTTTTNCYHLWVTTTGSLVLAVDGTTASITSSVPQANYVVKTYTWTHIAIVRSSGVIYMYINGTAQTSSAVKATQFGDTGVLNIGRYQPTPGQYFTGFITNVRFVYGTSIYNNAYPDYFTPPYTAPLTAITNTTLLLLQSTLTKDNSANNVTVTNTSVLLSTYTNPYSMMQLPTVLTAQSSRDNNSTTGIRDNSMHNATLTSGSLSYASYQNTVSPFGVTPALLLGQSGMTRDNSINNYAMAASGTPNIMPYVTPFSGEAIAFNGSTQYITGSSIYNGLGGDFTIEFFMIAGPQTATVGGLLLGKNDVYTTSFNNYYIMCSNANVTGQTIKIYNYILNTTGPIYSGSITVCDSEWHHIAIVRISNIVTVYVDGVIDTGTQGTSNRFTSTTTWDYSNYTIGSSPTTSGYTVAQLAYNGMLSNLRIINGTGIYTGTFTPPTNTLTKSQTSGTNIVAYTPSVPPSSTSYSLQYKSQGSAYPYLAPAVGTNLYTNDYTVEFWHYLSGRVTGAIVPCFFSNGVIGVAGNLSMYAGHTSSNIAKYQIAFNTNTFPSFALVSTSDVIYGKWAHIAVVRRSGIVYLYINGVLDSSSTYGNYNVYGLYWYIGTAGEGNSTHLNGFISNLRVVNGVGVYTGNFTVPSSALTATQSSGTNISAISNSLVANGGAVQMNTTSQTINNYYGAPFHWNTGLSDWTVESWVFLNALPTVDTWASGCMVLFGSDTAVATDGIHCVIGATQLFIAASNTKYGTATHGMSIYTWYHVAYVRYNNIVYFYVNGTLVGSVSDVPYPGTQSTTYIAGAAGTTIYSLNGYMSNLRVIKGLAAYTNAFTPTIVLPASQNSSTNINAISGTSTSALILQNSTTTDASTNNFTLTVNGAPSVSSTVVPYFPVTNGYSVYFNGGTSNDKLTLAASNAFDFSGGTWTIEFWMYPTVMPTSGNECRILMFGTNSSANAYDVSFNNSGGILAIVPLGSPTRVEAVAGTITINTWYHIAVSCNLGFASLYVNGVLKSGPTNVLLPTTGAITLNIGYDTVGTVNFQYQGYLSNLRIVKGIGVYTGTFTPPTSPLTLTQSSGTNINAITDVTPSDGYSLSFSSGNSQQLTLPSNAAFAMGTGSFTIECWFYTYSAGTAQAIYDTRSPVDTANIGYDLYLTTTGAPLRFGTNGSNYITGSTAIFSNRWYHVAVVRESTTVIKMYLNGVQEGTTYTASATQNFTNNTPKIGGGVNAFFNGFISNLRVVKGQALYTATFTPSNTPFTKTSQNATASNVSLLTAQNATIIDNSNNTFTITNSSSPVISNSVVTPFLATTQLLMLQNSRTTDSSVNTFVATITGSPSLNLTNMAYMPFVLANGNSVFFNGPTNYITIPSNAAFTFGTGDFTIEGWVYISVGTTSTLFDSRTGSNTVHPVLYVSDTVRYRVAGTDVIVGTTLSTSTWYHIAVSRNSGSTKLYVNGIQSGSTYADSNDYLIGAPLVGAGYGYNAPLIGYISNLRVVKGTGVYPSKFNPITAPLTSTQSSTTNALTISAKLPVNGNAGYASGGISVRGQFTYGNGFLFPGNFTIEAWINPYSLTTAYKAWFDSRASASDVTGICVGLTNTTGQWGAFSANNTNYIVSSVNLTLNTWQHVAVVRIGVMMSLYLNGRIVATTPVTNKFYTGNSYLGSQSDVTYGWIGYISNLRVVRDVAVYTGNFTPPTSPLTWYQPSGTNIVGSTKPAAPTNGNSVFFNGTTDYLVATTISAYQFTGNYSIECWFYTTTSSTSQMIMSKVSNKSTIDWYLKLNAYPGAGSTYATSSDPNSCQLEFYQGSPSVLLQSPVITYSSDTRSRMGGIYPNTWNHVAIVRNGNAYYMIINGAYYNTSTMSTTVAGTPTYDLTNNVNIGVNGVDYASNFFSGYITNVRLVNGTIAYSPSYFFSPSFMPLSTTQALNNFVASQTQNQTGVLQVTSAQTALLGLQNTITGDNSTNNNTLTAYGTPSLSTTEHPFTLPLNGYAAYFNGQAYLQSSNNPTDFTTNTAWTIEAWFHWTAPGLASQVIVDIYTALTTNEISIRTGTANTVIYVINSTTAITSAATVVSDAWNHVAVVKNGATTTLYLNGVSQGTTATVPTTGTRTVYIGSVAGSAFFQGYISNVRIVKDVAVYTGNFTVSTSPLTLTQSSGTNISAITGSSTLALVIQKDMITDMAGGLTMQVGGGTAWPVIPSFPFSPFLTTANYVPSLLAFQTSYMNDTSPTKALYALTGVQAGDATWMDYTYSPFGNITSLLAARTGKAIDNSILSRVLSGSGWFTRIVTPSGVQTPTAFLTAQTTTVLSDAGSDDLATQGAMNSPANASASTTFGPFNSDTPLLALQNPIVIDNSNVRAQLTVVGGGVSPTDSSPFTTSKSLTSLLIPYGYNDISIANTSPTYISNNANVAQTNFVYNPFTITSSLVSVLGLQTSNTVLESSMNNSTFTTSGTAPTSNVSSPFGTYYSNGVLILNTNSTTGTYGSNIVTYANLLVTAGDAVTTNAYSITITSLNNIGNIGNRTGIDSGLVPAQSNANFTISDVANSNIGEATILTFANTTITPALNLSEDGYNIAPSNATFIITDVANSNLAESLNDIFVSNVAAIRIPTDSGLGQVGPSNATFFITDVANSNISETIATVTISNVSTSRSIIDTGTQPPPSPVGGTVLFPTYAYTDGVIITAANVQSGGTSGTTASNQQIWYQT